MCIRDRILEEHLGGDAGPPDDYKIFMFDGKPAYVQWDTARFAGHTRRLYDPDWYPLDVHCVHPTAAPRPRPATLDRMLEVAADISAGFDFVRVDLYDVAGTVWFGEISPCASGGLEPFYPLEFDRALGELWHQVLD